MSLAPTTIPRAAWTATGGNYDALRARAIALVQSMAGDVWTDYNSSDPGVTILEQLCYALTELPYRAAVPVGTILSPPDRAALPLRRQGLFPAWAVMPSNPVTADDLRRLILDRVPDVANVWFTPADTSRGRGVAGLYDVAILPMEKRQDGHGAEDLARAVARCYSAHRGLCEDILRPRVLTRIDTWVHAQVSIGHGADPSDTLAAILFALGLYLTPEPKRQSLEAALAAGGSTAEILSGTLMLRGLIPADQMAPLQSGIAVDALRQVLASAPGVAAVDRMSVTVHRHRRPYHGRQRIPVPEGGILALCPFDRDGRPTIRMVRDHEVCQPDEGRTRRRLAELWRDQRRTYPLRGAYARHFGVPLSQYQELASYSSVQDEFPAIYGIGANWRTPMASDRARAHANQLIGYLMVYDQLLADAFSQLAFIRDLFSVEAGGDRTYAVQSLRPIVPGADAVLAEGYEEGLAALSAETDPVDRRRKAVLDMLLSFYAEAIGQPDAAGRQGGRAALHQGSLIHTKQALLRQLPALTRDRGKGMDYHQPDSHRRASGLERMSRLELGVADPAGGQAQDGDRQDPGPDGPVAVPGPGEATFGRLLPVGIIPAVERFSRPVSPDVEDGGAGSWGRSSPLAGHRVARALLESLPDRERYRVVTLSSSGVLVLVCRDRDGAWWLIGEYADESLLLDALRALMRAADRHRWRHRRHAEPYIVEWVLLRHARRQDHHQDRDGCDPESDQPVHGGWYDFRVSAVMHDRDSKGSAGWRDQCREVLRRNAPAHVALHCVFLDQPSMRRFRRLYQAWADSLCHGSPHRRQRASWHLERFLLDHGARPDWEPPGPGADASPPGSSPAPPPPPPPPPEPPAAGAAQVEGPATAEPQAPAPSGEEPGMDSATDPPTAPQPGTRPARPMARVSAPTSASGSVWSWLSGKFLGLVSRFR